MYPTQFDETIPGRVLSSWTPQQGLSRPPNQTLNLQSYKLVFSICDSKHASDKRRKLVQAMQACSCSASSLNCRPAGCESKLKPWRLVDVTRLLPRNSRRKTTEPKKPLNSLRRGPEVIEKERDARDQVAQRARSWTVQNKMRDVLGRMTAAAA